MKPLSPLAERLAQLTGQRGRASAAGTAPDDLSTALAAAEATAGATAGATVGAAAEATAGATAGATAEVTAGATASATASATAQSTGTSAALSIAAHGSAGFAERLQRLQTRARAFQRPSDETVAEHLGGRVRSEGLIEIVRQHPLSTPHGSHTLEGLAVPELCWLTGGAADGPRPDLLFIDTETTGLAGGSGTLAFLIGVGEVSDDALVITQWLITRFAAEAALLEALAERVRTRTGSPGGGRPIEWVSFNGKSFDLPLLSTRLRLARLTDAVGGHAHHDLLHPTRTAFARHWPDCRLQTVEQRLLGVFREHDLPGHRIPAVWADFVQFGEIRDMFALVLHNRIDLLSLAALLPRLSQLYLEPRPANPQPGSDHDVAAIARMQRRRRRTASARAHLSASEASLDCRALLELASLHRSQCDWANATRLWHTLAQAGSTLALEALAKHHEHVSGDLDQALHFAAALCRSLPACPAAARRLQRLQTRQQRRQAVCRTGMSSLPSDLFDLS